MEIENILIVYFIKKNHEKTFFPSFHKVMVVIVKAWESWNTREGLWRWRGLVVRALDL